MEILFLVRRVFFYTYPGIYFFIVGICVISIFIDELLGAGRKPIPPLSWGDAGPEWEESVLKDWERNKSYCTSDYVREYIKQMVDKPLPDWKKHGKGYAPHICLALLACGERVNEVNEYLQKLEPWSHSGSSWWVYRGDYDFTEVILTMMLYLFGDKQERIYPETLDHLLHVLLVEEGGKPREMVPKSWGLIRDTENHHLMTESSRYLKNQWLFKYGSSITASGNPIYDNKTNGLEEWLVNYLDEMLFNGEYEFNSIPYLLYAVEALLNLEAFPDSEEVRIRAHKILDSINWKYALGSLQFRRYAPFRRRFEYANITSLVRDPHTALMRWWCLPESKTAPGKEETKYSQIISAVLSPYIVPPVVKQWAFEKPYDYFVRIGYGKNGSPEIYSGGKEYLISAGGVYRGLRAMIVPRPITLLLNDGEIDLNRCFHIKGRGKWWCWNNTGVYKKFAVGNAPVHIPPQYSPIVQKGLWSVFAPEDVKNLYIGIYSDDNFGLLYLSENKTVTPDEWLDEIIRKNPSKEGIRSSFVFWDGKRIEYDINAPAGMWVIKSVEGEEIDRYYDNWPRWNGNIPVNLYGE